MGILSKIFGGSCKQDNSYVRAWAKRRHRELRTSDDLTPENLFALLMWGLATFGEKDQKHKSSTAPDGMGVDASANYSGDASLFEVGCYMHFRIDLWLYHNKPERREEICMIFAREFINLFTKALGFPSLSNFFDQRVSGFGQLARKRADVEEYHHHLSQLILRSKDGGPPEEYDFETAPLMTAGFFEYMGVKIALASWELGMLPAIANSLENYCEMT